jgi:hypothetical protein
MSKALCGTGNFIADQPPDGMGNFAGVFTSV